MFSFPTRFRMWTGASPLKHSKYTKQTNKKTKGWIILLGNAQVQETDMPTINYRFISFIPLDHAREYFTFKTWGNFIKIHKKSSLKFGTEYALPT